MDVSPGAGVIPGAAGEGLIGASDDDLSAVDEGKKISNK